MSSYELLFHPEALAEWNALDFGVRARLKKKLAKRLENPSLESARLSADLHNCFVIRAHRDGIRIVYLLRSEELKFIVLSVGKREDFESYLNASFRIHD